MTRAGARSCSARRACCSPSHHIRRCPWCARTSSTATPTAKPLAFSPDARLLGVGTEDGRVLLRDATDGTRAGPAIQAATGAIDPISFSPDSRLVAASSAGQTTTLWDVPSRKRLGRTFPVRQGVVPAAQFAPDGNLVIVGLADAAVWPMTPLVWKRFACRVAGRDLTRAEWDDVLPDRPYRVTCHKEE